MSDPNLELNDNIYIYRIRDNQLVFDRSVSRKGLGLARGKNVQNQIFKILGGNMTPNKKLSLMLELHNRLNGHCSMDLSTCPKWMLVEDQKNAWECSDCTAMFEGIIDLRKRVPTADSLLRTPCPCKYAPDIAISRLEEYIEELKQEVSIQ